MLKAYDGLSHAVAHLQCGHGHTVVATEVSLLATALVTQV